MDRKTLALSAGTILAVGLISWFLGRQIAGREAGSPPPPSAQGPATPLRAKALTAKDNKAPGTPIHEKAFLLEQLKTNPSHAPILLRLGEVESSLGELKEARGHLEQAIKADASLIDARLELSMVCYQLKDEAEAERQNLLVLKQDPKQADALYNLGAISANRNQFREARNYWQDAVRYGAATASGGKAASALASLPRGISN